MLISFERASECASGEEGEREREREPQMGSTLSVDPDMEVNFTNGEIIT